MLYRESKRLFDSVTFPSLNFVSFCDRLYFIFVQYNEVYSGILNKQFSFPLLTFHEMIFMDYFRFSILDL